MGLLMIRVPSCLTVTLSLASPGSKTPPPPPSRIQNRVGVGFPALTQSKEAVEPGEARTTPGGWTRNTGGAETI